MKRITITGIIFILLMSSLSFSTIGEEEIGSKTIYVDDSGGADYTSIQDAIDNSSVGDTIFVSSGIYYESLWITHPIFLYGESRYTTFIHGGNQSNVDEYVPGIRLFQIDSVIISDFSICYWYSGIYLHSNAYNITIINCNIYNNSKGLGLQQLCGDIPSIIQNNQINNNTRGISLSYENQVEIKDNHFINNDYGIDFWCSFHNDHCYITNNIFRENLIGIDFQMVYETFIENNSFIKNHNGILLQGCKHNSIKLNVFKDNQLGIRLNDFFSMQIMTSVDNDIIKNNFIGNEVHAYFYFQGFTSLPFLRQNGYSNNYWDDWNGFGPKPIWGIAIFIIFFIPVFQCDWHPAKEPYTI